MPILIICTRIGCSVRCDYCPQDVLIKAYGDDCRVMDLDTFKEYLKKIPTNVQLNFSGFTEPWGNEQCTDMVLLAAKTHVLTTFTTLHGMTVQDAKRMLDVPWKQFNIHLPDKMMHADITDEYLEVLSVCMRMKKRGFMLWGETPPEVRRVVGNVKPAAGLHNRAGVMSKFMEKYEHRGRISCSGNRHDMNHNVLLPDGRVVFCCVDFGLRHIMGNLKTQAYESLFKGKEADLLRAGFRGESRILCHSCENAVVGK